MRYAFSLLTALCFSTLFVCLSVQATQASKHADDYTEQDITTDRLHLSLSVGAGVITNPLHGGDNIPLVLIPQVAFYAEQWFFDNGRIGYSFLQTPKHHFNLVGELNSESRFFIDWHPKNVFSLQSSTLNNQFVMQDEASSSRYVDIDNLHKRQIALDAGIAYHYVNEDHVFSVQALHDITDVYRGARAALQWQYHTVLGKLKIKPTLGINYKSAELNSYFYGLNEGETQFGKIDVGSSWQPYAKIDARWPLGKADSLRFHVAYYDYSTMDGSPLFERTYSMTAFIGFDRTF